MDQWRWKSTLHPWLTTASGPSSKPSGGFLLTEAPGAKDSELVAGKIGCFTQVGNTYYLVGQITNDEGTVFGDGVDENNDYILITIVEGGSEPDQVAIAQTESGSCNQRTDTTLLRTVQSGSNITFAP